MRGSLRRASTIDFLTLYAFSAENWQRPKSEVFALMRLLKSFFKEKTPELIEKNVRLQAIGRLTDLPVACQKQLHKSIEETASNTGVTLILALSYGGRSRLLTESRVCCARSSSAISTRG